MSPADCMMCKTLTSLICLLPLSFLFSTFPFLSCLLFLTRRIYLCPEKVVGKFSSAFLLDNNMFFFYSVVSVVHMCDIIRILPGEFLCNVGCMAVCDVSFFLALWNIWNFVWSWCEKYDNYLRGIKEIKEHLMCFATIYCYFAIPCILYGHSCLTWMGYCWKMKKESYFLKTWNHFSFITRSHGQMTLLCSGSLIYWLQHVSALQELFHSWSFSAGSICCTTELCNESSAAGAPCCDLNAPCGWEGSEGWEKRAEQSRT